MLGKFEAKRKRGQQRMTWLNGITDSMDMNQSKFWGIIKDKEAWCTAVHGVTKRLGISSDYDISKDFLGISQSPQTSKFNIFTVIITQHDKSYYKENERRRHSSEQLLLMSTTNKGISRIPKPFKMIKASIPSKIETRQRYYPCHFYSTQFWKSQPQQSKRKKSNKSKLERKT